MQGQIKGKWQTLSKNKVYDNPWITVEHHQVITPGGSDGIYGKVHFKNLAIGILPIDDHGYTWLVGQHRYTIDQYSWEIPMGGGLVNTDPLTAAQRELREETGLKAKRWTPLIHLHTSNSVTDEYSITYLAQELSRGTMDQEDTEDITVQKIHFDEALQMVLSGEITDAVSACAILKYAVARQQQ